METWRILISDHPPKRIMTTGGAIILTLSVGFVTILFAYCLYKVIRRPKNGAIQGAAGSLPHSNANSPGK